MVGEDKHKNYMPNNVFIRRIYNQNNNILEIPYKNKKYFLITASPSNFPVEIVFFYFC